MSASDYWSTQLAAWAIPNEILAQAPTSPWIHPVELFEVGVDDAPTLDRSAEIALAALPTGGSVLDVGCGGGRAAIALAAKAGIMIGVDHQADMLRKFGEAVGRRNIDHLEVLGDWPAVADQTPVADVALAHHVIYNVSNLAAFSVAMDSHARCRVVLEAPRRHPLSNLSDLWLHFWGLERPKGPTADDALAAIREAGFPAQIEYFNDVPKKTIPIEKQVEFTRIRLCLSDSKDAEIRALLENRIEKPRELTTIWWETQ